MNKLFENWNKYLNEQEGSIDIESIINNALKNAELPLTAQDVKAFYHAKPSERIFLIPTDDQYAAMSPAYRPKRGGPGKDEWVFPEERPQMPNIDAGKVEVDINTLVDALSDAGLSSWSETQYVGPSYSNAPIPSGWAYDPEWGWYRAEEEPGEEWEIEWGDYK
jgi:hypothetical protein